MTSVCESVTGSSFRKSARSHLANVLCVPRAILNATKDPGLATISGLKIVRDDAGDLVLFSNVPKDSRWPRRRQVISGVASNMSGGKRARPETDEQNLEGAVVVPPSAGELAADIRGLIEAARVRIAQAVNAELAFLNWQIGSRIRRDILAEARAEYGEQIVSTLSRQLTADYGAGFSRQNLFHMIRFVEAWPDEKQVTALAQHLGWSHFKEILYLDNQLARQFYAEMCRLEHWSVRTLRERVRGMLFERTAISRLPEATIHQDLEQLRKTDRLTPELVFRDPYLLDFIGLKDAYETAILRELERFLLELGTDLRSLPARNE